MTFDPQSMRLETDRLILRIHDKSDFPARLALWQNPDVVRHIGNFKRSEEEAWERMLFLVGHWQINGYGYWVVEEKESGNMIGEAGFMDAKRDMTPPYDNRFEAGWVIDPRHHGRGLAREAMAAALTWLDQRFDHPDTFCIIGSENKASLKLADRLGYQFLKNTVYKESQIDLLVRPGR